MIFSKYKSLKLEQSNIKRENIQIQNVNTNINTIIHENNKFAGSVRFGMIDRILYNNNCKSCGK